MSQKITFEQLDTALNGKGLSVSKLTMEKLCNDYNGYCAKCANPNKTEKFDCGCGGPKMKL